jgi:hypothetical protein
MKDLETIIQVRNADVDFKIQLVEPLQGGIDGVASMRVSNCETTRYSFFNCLLSVCLAQRMVSTSSGKTNWTGCRNISWEIASGKRRGIPNFRRFPATSISPACSRDSTASLCANSYQHIPFLFQLHPLVQNSLQPCRIDCSALFT